MKISKNTNPPLQKSGDQVNKGAPWISQFSNPHTSGQKSKILNPPFQSGGVVRAMIRWYFNFSFKFHIGVDVYFIVRRTVIEFQATLVWQAAGVHRFEGFGEVRRRFKDLFNLNFSPSQLPFLFYKKALVKFVEEGYVYISTRHTI